MAGVTPRRSLRIPHTHTPKMSERKKGLFQSEAESTQESLTMHRQLPVVDSESDSEDYDLGIISTLDSSSGDENNLKTPEKTTWCGTRNHTGRLLKENQDLKNFIKSPFTLKKYQTRYSCPDNGCTGSQSTPATPHLQNHPGTPTSAHSCASVHTTSSTSSKARKSLASLIADTESCSSSLKDLNFDSDSGTDSKENTPVKPIRKSTRKKKMTPKFQSFKGILAEQKRNSTSSPKSSFVNLTKMDFIDIISPTQMLKTPNSTSEVVMSPPKLGHNRRSAVEISESPETPCSSDKSHKRHRNESITDAGPNSKYIKLDTPSVPKARQSLFSSDRLKEILSTKMFYGKSNPDLNNSMTAKISSAIESTHTNNRRSFTHSHSLSRRKRRPGQINLGVRHKIRKPKIHNKFNVMYAKNSSLNNSTINNSSLNNSATSLKDASMLNSSQELDTDKTDPFGKEKQTIEELLSQWTEEDVPESEMLHAKITQPLEVPCFSSQVIDETSNIFQPITITRVTETAGLSQGSDVVIVELGSGNTTLPQVSTNLPQNMAPQSHDVVMSESDHVSSHGDAPKGGEFLPVEGGYILVDNELQDEELTDLDEIEKELKMLDEQILQMAQSNNINPEVVLASTEPVLTKETAASTGLPDASKEKKADKLFSIFSKPNPGTTTPTSKGSVNRRIILKSAKDQYIIDAGQKKFGATQCKECGVIYQIGDPQDEHDHLVHHNSTDVLKFNGWKEEYVVGTWEAARCIRVRGGEAGWKRVEKLLERIVHPQLGYDARLPGTNTLAYTAFLYIEKKQIIGCLIMEPKTTAYKFMPGDPDCCSVEGYPVRCGVSRLWTHVSYRRRGVAYRLLQCARTSFFYGEALDLTEIAFSAPTTAGKAFATAYCKTPNFYVYID